MEKVLVDRFVVPEESKAEFLGAARKSAEFVKTLPGFIEGFIYEKTHGESTHNVITTAVWKGEEEFEAAKTAAKAEFDKIGFNPQEIMKALNVTIERAVYQRKPY